MNPFTFTKFRVKLFIGLLLSPIGFVLLRFVPIIGSLTTIFALVLIFAFQALMVGPAHLFPQLFNFQEFGPLPVGLGGSLIEVGCYLMIIFLLSWFGNLKKDKPV